MLSFSECHIDFVIVNTSNYTEKMTKEKTQARAIVLIIWMHNISHT